MLFDDFAKLIDGTHVSNRGTETPSTAPALNVAAGILAHQHRALLGAESLDHQIAVSQQYIALFGERWIGRNRFASERGPYLPKNPGSSQRSSPDHDAVDRIAMKGVYYLFRRI